MAALFIALGIVVAVGTAALVVTLQRTRDEVEPTIEAFTAFRAALRPGLEELRDDTSATSERLARGRIGTPRG